MTPEMRALLVMLLVALAAALSLAAVFLYRQVVRQRAMLEELRGLRSAQHRVDRIVESAMDAIITVDEHQNVVLFNKAAEAVFGLPREEAIGAPLSDLLPKRFRTAHAEHLERFAHGGTTSRRMGMQRIVAGLRRNGEEFPIDASISQVSDGGRRLFTVILRDVTERVRNEDELRHSRDEIRALGLASNNVREQEKSRIARELHDELGQALSALKIDVDWLTARVPAGDPAVRTKLAVMQDHLDGTVAATRRISADLRPLVLDDLGLVAAAEWLTQSFAERTGIPCELLIESDIEALRDPHATTVFRVLQESLTNVAKHAAARRVLVKLSQDAEQISLEVSDDGVGFEPGGPRNPASLGLLGQRERAYLLGGEVSVRSSPGRGTIVEMRLPQPESGSTE